MSANRNNVNAQLIRIGARPLIALIVLLALTMLLAALVLRSPAQAAFLAPVLDPIPAAPAVSHTQVYTHEGPLILTGTQVYTIENTTFVQHGPVEVHDQAMLIIRASTIEFPQSYHEEFQWYIDGSAQLVIDRSTISSPYMHSLVFGGSSQGEISDSALPEAFLPMAGAAIVTITNSSVAHVSLDPVNFGSEAGQVAVLNAISATLRVVSLAVTGEVTGTVRGLHPGLQADWTLNGLSNPQIAVRLVDTQIEYINWAIAGNAQVVFEDCKLEPIPVNESRMEVSRPVLAVLQSSDTICTNYTEGEENDAVYNHDGGL